MRKLAVIFLLLLTLPLLAGTEDPYSFSKPQEAIIKHLHLELTVNFDQKELDGKASLEIDNKKQVQQLYLDTSNLDVRKVTLDQQERETQFQLGPAVEFRGQPLIIQIRPDTKFVHIYYQAGKESEGLQWLDPPQTAGGRYPFLFAQSNLARRWIPCQDTPSVRFTYSARVKIPPHLLALMSATNPQKKNPDGIYEFKMELPIPSYLVALAVGDVEFRSIGKRTGVYAEPSIIEKAAWEFAETEQMLEAAESLYGKYRWGRYDLIVLPPSFPWGGMENPRLTFATPTILAGDRSLVSLIAHELAHSWSGNVVTNGTWNHFWLNEGFTTYIEHRIVEKVDGRKFADQQEVLNFQDLQQFLQRIGLEKPGTQLYLDETPVDPEDATRFIVYEKGAAFLRTLERIVGREKFDPFLRKYVDDFAFQSITTQTAVEYMKKHLVGGDQQLEEKLKIDEWVFKPGLPSNVALPPKDAFIQVDAELKSWRKGKPPSQIDGRDWNTKERLYFLRGLPKDLTASQMAELDAVFHFTDTGNSEVLSEWLALSIEKKYEAAYAAIENFLLRIGRTKYVAPLYGRLARTPEGMEFARKVYAKARPTYHSLTRGAVDNILKWTR